MKGCIWMIENKNMIEKICKFALSFSNMNTVFIDPLSHVVIEYGYNKIPDILSGYIGNQSFVQNIHKTDSDHDVFFYSSGFKINFICAKVYDDENYLGSIIVGPYLLEEPTALMLEDIIYKNNLSISLRHSIKQYYLGLPLIGTYKAKTIAEFLAYISSDMHSMNFESLKIGDISYNFKTEYLIDPDTLKENTELSMATIEKRYSSENELMFAIENGDREKIDKFLLEDLSSYFKISDRIPSDPLRSRKNLSFVLNTLLRKSAQKGGVHPFYINSISEKFAIQIEKTSSLKQLLDLQNIMILDYCDVVKKFSLKNFNYAVRKAIEFIRISLYQDLSLDMISSSINTNPYELSRQFKKETGKTIIEYINKQRINEAIYIMENENISITSVAGMVGYNDINYFTKVFKKIKGITPSQYRKLNF